MTGVEVEFATVDLLLRSGAKTQGVDAFALSVIKAEKQARRLVSYLVYQFPWCDTRDTSGMKEALESRKVYMRGLLRGWDAIYPASVAEIVGPEYPRLKGRLDEAKAYRNKIFHGQLTGKGLSTGDLTALAEDIRCWCEALGSGTRAEVGYDGCERNSFRKAQNPAALRERYRIQLGDCAAYGRFIDKYMTD